MDAETDGPAASDDELDIDLSVEAAENESDCGELQASPQAQPVEIRKESVKDSTIRSRRHRTLCPFLPMLPANVVDSAILFVKCFNKISDNEQLKQQLKSIEMPKGQLRKNQMYYKLNKLCTLINSKKVKSIQHDLFSAWLSRLLFNEVDLPESLIPPSFHIARCA